MRERLVIAGACVTGFLAAPALTLGAIWLAGELTPGLQIQCRGLLVDGGVCTFDTGPLKTTPRWKAKARWRWHKARQVRGRCRP
jgi:hypothetical protein